VVRYGSLESALEESYSGTLGYCKQTPRCVCRHTSRQTPFLGYGGVVLESASKESYSDTYGTICRLLHVHECTPLVHSRSDQRSQEQTPLMGVEFGVWYWSLHKGVFCRYHRYHKQTPLRVVVLDHTHTPWKV